MVTWTLYHLIAITPYMFRTVLTVRNRSFDETTFLTYQVSCLHPDFPLKVSFTKPSIITRPTNKKFPIRLSRSGLK